MLWSSLPIDVPCWEKRKANVTKHNATKPQSQLTTPLQRSYIEMTGRYSNINRMNAISS